MARYKDISEVEKRVSELSDWLKEEAPECLSEQKQLNEGTQERAYWHYGYMVALRDVLRFLTNTDKPSRKQYSVDKSSSHPVA